MASSPRTPQQPPTTAESDGTLTTTCDDDPNFRQIEAEKAIPPRPIGLPVKVVIIELVRVMVMLWVLFWAASCFINGKMVCVTHRHQKSPIANYPGVYVVVITTLTYLSSAVLHH